MTLPKQGLGTWQKKVFTTLPSVLIWVNHRRSSQLLQGFRLVRRFVYFVLVYMLIDIPIEIRGKCHFPIFFTISQRNQKKIMNQFIFLKPRVVAMTMNYFEAASILLLSRSSVEGSPVWSVNFDEWVITSVQLPEPVEVTVMLQQSGIPDGKVAAPVVQYFPGMCKPSFMLWFG